MNGLFKKKKFFKSPTVQCLIVDGLFIFLMFFYVSYGTMFDCLMGYYFFMVFLGSYAAISLYYALNELDCVCMRVWVGDRWVRICCISFVCVNFIFLDNVFG